MQNFLSIDHKICNGSPVKHFQQNFVVSDFACLHVYYPTKMLDWSLNLSYAMIYNSSTPNSSSFLAER